MLQDNELEKIDVLTLLPQRPPFVMIDALTHYDENRTRTRFLVREDNIFMEEGTLNPCAIAENIAQTCAARLGYFNTYINKDRVRLGFIGSIKNMTVVRPARLGEVLTTEIEVVMVVMAVTLVSAVVKVGEETIATTQMEIALSDIEATEEK